MRLTVRIPTRVANRTALAVEQNVAGRERGMSAQLHLHGRSEPAQVVVGVVALARNGEGGLAEIVLGRDRLQQIVVEPAIERHHRGRIAGQRPVGERVDLEERQAGHVALAP